MKTVVITIALLALIGCDSAKHQQQGRGATEPPAGPTTKRAYWPVAKRMELYSWKPVVGKGWHFNLLAGTNRQRALAQMTASETAIVKVTDLKAKLASLARDKLVYWGHLAKEPVPQSLIEDLAGFCTKRKIILMEPRAARTATGHLIIALPRPNSGEFTFAEAEARRPEIYELSPSGMMPGWKNPSSGFCVHITEADEIIVYNSFLDDGKVTLDQLKSALARAQSFVDSVAVCILVTSAHDPKQSKVLPAVVELLFEPGIRIFYLREPHLSSTGSATAPSAT